MLIGAFQHGLYTYDGKSITPFVTECDTYFRDYKLYKGILLCDSTFALGT